MAKLSDTQARLLAYINEGNVVVVTSWGGKTLSSTLPCGNARTIAALADRDLVKVRRLSAFAVEYSKG